MFSGPFLLWASKAIPAVRGDFCGPDGAPIVSFKLDSTGCLVYQPVQAEAYFFPGGIPVGNGFLDVYAVISLVRTGYPSVPVQWKMVASCDTSLQETGRWSFVTAEGADTAVVLLEYSEVFPSFSMQDFSLEVTATSWHDEFNAWPMEWRLGSLYTDALVRIRSYDVDKEPAASVWNLVVPVPVDTVASTGGRWSNSYPFPIR